MGAQRDSHARRIGEIISLHQSRTLEDQMSNVTRRDFLKYLGAGAVGLIARPKLPLGRDNRFIRALDASDVVQCYHEQATTGNTINEPVVQLMVDESIKALAGLSSVGEAWKTIFPGITDTSVIGIKVNCVNNQLPSHAHVVRCIAAGLAQMDLGGTLFKKNNIIVWDRTNNEMTSCGYTLYTGSDPDTMRVFGTNQSGVGYDSGTPLNVNGVSENPSKILSQLCDYLIDLAVLKTHSGGTVTLGLKNHYGSVHSPTSLQHSGGCPQSIPSLNQQIRDVITPNNIQKLFIIDGLFGIYSGGPGGAPNFNPKVIIMSRDPVACDYQGQNVINAERQRRSLTPVSATHITNAALPPYSLGTTEINLIEINNVGVSEPGRGNGRNYLQVTPEPLRDAAEVSFDLARAGRVRLELLDAAGRSAASVFSGSLGAGRHRVPVRASSGLRAGTYFLRLSGPGVNRLRKLTIAR